MRVCFLLFGGKSRIEAGQLTTESMRLFLSDIYPNITNYISLGELFYLDVSLPLLWLPYMNASMFCSFFMLAIGTR
jgi:hypothetical protein